VKIALLENSHGCRVNLRDRLLIVCGGRNGLKQFPSLSDWLLREITVTPGEHMLPGPESNRHWRAFQGTRQPAPLRQIRLVNGS
jgi:hypothetical protein